VARVSEHAIAVTGLKPTYLNNAVAALRLSNLPAVVWWRGGSLESLDDLVDLADRFVMDAEEPDAVWEHAVKLFEHTALTDLRWAALTRWRAALAHLFDLPQVRRRAAGLTSVTIAACDTAAARLYAAWLQSSLEWGKEVAIAIKKQASDPPCPPLHGVTLDGGGLSIALNLRTTKTCVEASVDGVDVSARIVPLGDGSLKTLIGEELTVRTRDLAFERALVAAREITA
jgi:glucose-6-phosphate dehydrogenase assembly protein OpcA